MKITKICDECGGAFKVHPCRISTARWCSKKCAGLGMCISPQELFERYVKIAAPEGCWEWSGARDRDGYGICGNRSGSEGERRAHRFSYELHFGPITEGFIICHRCDNPPCCNPAHLYLGTDADNATDRKDRLGYPLGCKNSNAKLTESTVGEIKAALRSGMSGYRLAKQFGVSERAINFIRHGRTWKHVE